MKMTMSFLLVFDLLLGVSLAACGSRYEVHPVSGGAPLTLDGGGGG
jgi:hypothetical protein